eukprot:Gb_08648 [translate_table: standard]
MKVFSAEEVKNHNNEGDCWLVIHGKVYDVSKFMDEHPPGGYILVEVGGTDATKDFEDVGHSEETRQMMEKFVIGVIEEHISTKPVLAEPPLEISVPNLPEDAPHSVNRRQKPSTSNSPENSASAFPRPNLKIGICCI